MGSGGFKRLSDILPRVYSRIGLEEKLRERELISLWPEIVGQEVAARTRAVRFKKGVLFVEVSHGAWLQELRFREKEIMAKLSGRFPGLAIEAIRFTGRREF